MTRLFILWSNSYSVGINTIDSQHKKLVDIINSLYESFVDQTAAQKLEPILNELIDYSQYHFKTEEDLFHDYDYPKKNVHISKHQGFIKKINEFHFKVVQEKVNITYQLMNFLRNWLLDHIQSEDQEYSVFLRSKGIKENQRP